MGGAAALQIGLHRRPRHGPDPDEHSPTQRADSAPAAKGFAHLVGLLGARKELLEQAASRLFSHTCLVAYPDKVQAWLEEASGLDGKSIRAGVLALAGRDSVDMRLERITTRTLAIASSQDVLTPPHKLQQIVDRLPNARMKTIDRAGHFALMEKPGEVIEVIRGFTKELRGCARRSHRSHPASGRVLSLSAEQGLEPAPSETSHASLARGLEPELARSDRAHGSPWRRGCSRCCSSNSPSVISPVTRDRMALAALRDAVAPALRMSFGRWGSARCSKLGASIQSSPWSVPSAAGGRQA